MKTSWLVVAWLVCTIVGARAQVASTSTRGGVGQPVLPASTPYSIVQRAANSQVWERTVYEPGPSGQAIPRKHRYTELATGLNFKDPQTGQLRPSKEKIDILPNGTAAATQGQHQVHFPCDIAQGVIELVTPDGKHLKSRPVGLSYDDGSKTVLIGELKDSVGYALSSGLNQPAAVAAVDDPMTEEFYVADTGNNRILLCSLAADDPTPAWTNMTAHVANGDISGAMQQFYSVSTDRYRQAFVAMGTNNLVPIINQVGTLTPVYIQGNNAEYYFQQTFSGQTVTFTVEFVKENGVWKIEEF